MKQRNNSTLATLLLIIAFHLPSFAQDPFDCIYPIDVCDHSTIYINYPSGVSTVELDLPDLCSYSNLDFFLDANTVWLKYQFQSEGDFLFTITSVVPEVDIDFVVFKSATNTCDDLTAIRCMFTGANSPGPPDPICVGPTGLSANATDVEETPGCGLGDDNFLAPIQANTEVVYYLAIIAWTDSSSYTIEHSGSAQLYCKPSAIDERNENEITLYPTAACDRLYVELEKPESEVFSLQLYNNSGEMIESHQFKNKMELDIHDLPIGMYYTKIYSSKSKFYLRKFIKTNY